MSLIRKVQNTIFQHSLLKTGDKIILAVSGGPDSVALLDIFSKFQRKYDLKLQIAHVNYNLRGRDSLSDEKFVRKLAQNYGYNLTVKNIESPKNPSENYLRDLRYAFFEKLRKKFDYDIIAVAHTLDDQAETYLMRVLRGAGLAGLSAMKYKNNSIIRPLLDITRGEIIDYLKTNKLSWRTDKTNLQKNFLRNRVRNSLIPYLEKEFNQKIKHTLSNSAATIAQDYDFLNEYALNIFKKMPSLKISELQKFHPAIQRRIILHAICKKKKDLKNVEFAHIEEVLKIVKSTKSKPQIVSFVGLKITRRGDKLQIN